MLPAARYAFLTNVQLISYSLIHASTVLVGLFAGSDAQDRAVLTGLRNFLRDFGGATGTTSTYAIVGLLSRLLCFIIRQSNKCLVSGAILSHLLYSQLKSTFSHDLIAKLASSAFALKDLDLSDEERSMISQAYTNGLRAVFSCFAVLSVVHLCACLCIQDYGLKREDGKQQQRGIVEASTGESGDDEQR